MWRRRRGREVGMGRGGGVNEAGGCMIGFGRI